MKIFQPSELTLTVPSTFSHSLYYALPILQTLLLPSFTSKLTSPLILTILVQSFKHYSFYPSNLTPPILQSLLVLSLKPFYFYPLNLTPPIIPSLKPYYFYLLHLWNFSAPILYPFILITPWLISFSLFLTPLNKTGWCMQEKGSEKNRSRFRIVLPWFQSLQEQ